MNITCPKRLRRHPAVVTCRDAMLSARAAAEAEQEILDASRLKQFRVHDYNQAVLRVNIHCGPGAADAIIDLMKCWQALGEHNAK
jgi:hypothetical protein